MTTHAMVTATPDGRPTPQDDPRRHHVTSEETTVKAPESDEEATGGGSGGSGHPEHVKSFTGLLVPHLDENGSCDCMCDRCTVIHEDEGDEGTHECICSDCSQTVCSLHRSVTS